jgi:DNA-dependent metalloprotease WSS1
MVHLRLNENETNPNPHVNFITALSMVDPREQEQARQLLRALAAQVRPIMKAHGFVVNSLEEVCKGFIPSGDFEM